MEAFILCRSVCAICSPETTFSLPSPYASLFIDLGPMYATDRRQTDAKLPYVACNTTLDPSNVRRPSSLGPSTQRARVCLYVTLINNTVDVVSFSELCTASLFYTRPPRWCGTTDTWRRWLSWPKTPHESSSFLVRCRTPRLAMHGLKYPPLYQS